MKIRKPQGTLGWFSALWFILGVLSAFRFPTHGSWILGLLSAGIAFLAAGLWLGWTWVRLPFTIYWTLIALLSGILIFRTGFSIPALGNVLFAVYSAYLVYNWNPDEPEMVLLSLSNPPRDPSNPDS